MRRRYRDVSILNLKKKDYLELVALLQVKKVLHEAGMLKTMKKIGIKSVVGRYYKYAVAGTYIKRAFNKKFGGVAKDCYFGRLGDNTYCFRYYIRDQTTLGMLSREGFSTDGTYVNIPIFEDFIINQDCMKQATEMMELIKVYREGESARAEQDAAKQRAAQEEYQRLQAERNRVAQERLRADREREQARIQQEYIRKWNADHNKGGEEF